MTQIFGKIFIQQDGMIFAKQSKEKFSSELSVLKHKLKKPVLIIL